MENSRFVSLFSFESFYAMIFVTANHDVSESKNEILNNQVKLR